MKNIIKNIYKRAFVKHKVYVVAPLCCFFHTPVLSLEKEYNQSTQSNVTFNRLEYINRLQVQSRHNAGSKNQENDSFDKNVTLVQQLCKAGRRETAQAVADLYKNRSEQYRALLAIIEQASSQTSATKERIFIYLPSKESLEAALHQLGIFSFAQKNKFIEEIEQLKKRNSHPVASDVARIIKKAIRDHLRLHLGDQQDSSREEDLASSIASWEEKLFRALYIAEPNPLGFINDSQYAGVLHNTEKSHLDKVKKELYVAQGSTGFIQGTQSTTLSQELEQLDIFTDHLKGGIATVTYIMKSNVCPTTHLTFARPDLGYPHRPQIKQYAAITHYPYQNELHSQALKAALERGLNYISEIMQGKLFIFVPGQSQQNERGGWEFAPKKEYTLEIKKLSEVAKSMYRDFDIEVIPYQIPDAHLGSYESSIQVSIKKIFDHACGKIVDSVILESNLPGKSDRIKLH